MLFMICRKKIIILSSQIHEFGMIDLFRKKMIPIGNKYGGTNVANPPMVIHQVLSLVSFVR